LEWEPSARTGEDPFTAVHARVALALALKLLDEIGLATIVEPNGDVVDVRITFPLRAAVARDSHSMHSTSSPH
jgi:hypothetical protein